ncbi:MAG: hypothetical protein WCZ89_00845 [Phycisphaerae bacterium]
MKNELLEPIEYKVVRTNLGEWKSFGYSTGLSYHEFTSHAKIAGLPLIHYTYGRCPETGRRKMAKGVIAVGRIACGIIAIGQLAIGLIPIGQAAFGLLLGIGQLSTGLAAVGQAAIGFYFALGQLAVGYIAIGQFAIGTYALGQFAVGKYVLSTSRADEAAKDFFSVLPVIKEFFTK